MGKLHLMNCSHIEDVSIIAAADSSKKNLKFAESWGVKNLYSDYNELLNGSHGSLALDAIIVTLPNYLHFDCIRLALEEGLQVFVEKPLANTSEECRKIARLAERNSSKLMIGHYFRFLDAVVKMKKAVDSGLIGDLEVLTLEEIINGPFSPYAIPTPVPEWWFDPRKAGGGVMLDLGYHMLDLFRFFAGDPEPLFAFLGYRLNLQIEDSAIVIVHSRDSSVKGIINVGWYQNVVFPKFNFRLVLNGTGGCLSSDDYLLRSIYLHILKAGTKNLLRKILRRKIAPLSYTYYYEPFYKEMEHFFDCIRNDCKPSISAIDGLRTVELIEQSYKISSKTAH